MRWEGVFWLGLAWLGACSCAASGPPPSDAGRASDAGDAGAAASASAAGGAAPACATEKLGFTREQGCVNDGSVELCIPAEDPAAEQAARAIAGDLRCTRGSRGRAQCTSGEALCLVPLGGAECTGRHGALTDAGWAKVCALSMLPFVRGIVPTWYE